MGYGSFGGVSASLSHAFVDKAPGDGAFIANWVNMLDEARDRIVAQYGYGEEATRALELETVRVSIANIRTFRSEEHTFELQSLMRISYAVFCLKKKTTARQQNTNAQRELK